MTFTQVADVEVEDRATPRLPDPLSAVVGSDAFVRPHRIDLQLDGAVGRSPRLSVSRYYWNTEPPVAIDFFRELRFGPAEVSAKRAWCEQRGIRYALITGEHDLEGAEQQLAPPEQQVDPEEAPRPRTAPRRHPSKR